KLSGLAAIGENWRANGRGAAGTPSRVGLEHLLRVLARGFGELRSRQHTGNLLRPFGARNMPDDGMHSPRRLLLFDQVMMVGKGCNLRKVGHAEDLVGSGKLFQLPAHGFGGASANAGVNLIEHQGALPNWIFFAARGRRRRLHTRLEREHNAREFTSRGRLLQWSERLTR